MDDMRNAVWIELRKAIRSRMPLYTALGSLVMPLAGAFLMFVYKYPALSRQIGLISAKANLAGGTADWPSYLGILAQGIAVGGLILFSFIVSWVVGREFADGTLKDLLAVPVSRGTILLAKFVVVALWSLLLMVMISLVSLLLGAAIGLPQGSTGLFFHRTATLAIIACMAIVVAFPIAFFASVGRGYLLPMGIAALGVVLTNLIVYAGWGSYFPWAVPALYAGIIGGKGANLEPISYLIVLITGFAGIAGTYLWWNFADQNR
jgi:ABC-2 type transport system permease protein